MDTSEEDDSLSDDASEASEASVTTADSSYCDPQSPDDVPVISPPDLAAVLAAQDVTDVLLSEVTAPLVTISIEERALAPAAPLLRVPYLERLLEAVRDGTPVDRLLDALRPAVIQPHDDLATYITEIVLAMFDGDQLRSLPDQLQGFRRLADPLTVRRAVLTQMRYVADVASSLPSKAYSTSGGLFRLVWRQCRGWALTLRLRTVFLFVPQPVAACLRIPVAPRRRPELASILLSEQHPSACCYLAAKWQLDVAYTVLWYLLARGLSTLQSMLQPVPRRPDGAFGEALLSQGWCPRQVLQMPRERSQPQVQEIPLALRQSHAIVLPVASPLLQDHDVVRSLHFYWRLFLGGT